MYKIGSDVADAKLNLTFIVLPYTVNSICRPAAIRKLLVLDDTIGKSCYLLRGLGLYLDIKVV
jgi:hypothetical protein